MYTDNTPIPFGKYKFTSLCRLPPDYLLTFINHGRHVELAEYVANNIERIMMRKEGIIESPPFEFPCEKITYASEKTAKLVLSRISQIEQSHKKPIRHYECPKCGGWHLTSAPMRTKSTSE